MYKWTRDDADFLRCYGIAVWLSNTHEQLPPSLPSAEEDAEYEKYLAKYGQDTIEQPYNSDEQPCDGSSCEDCEDCDDEEEFE